jgi:hypothetical protein
MTFILSDIFIGNFIETQAFGVNPQNYAQFGLKGHNGLDFGCPNNTQIISTADGWVMEVGSDPTGYGNYVKVVHNGFLTIYGHFDHAVVKVNDKVLKGQLLGLSDNTGNSTGSHLHFGVAPCDAQGIKTETNNGFSGYINPNGDRCKWEIVNLITPITPKPPLLGLSIQVGYDPTFEGQDVMKDGVHYKSIKDSSGNLIWKIEPVVVVTPFPTQTTSTASPMPSQSTSTGDPCKVYKDKLNQINVVANKSHIFYKADFTKIADLSK